MAAEDAAVWFQPWARRLNNVPSKKPTRNDSLESNWPKLRQQLENGAPAVEQRDERIALQEIALETNAAREIIVETTGVELELEPQHGSSIGRWLAAGVLILLGGACYMRPGMLRVAAEAINSWPHAVSLILGVLWWIAFTPSFIGPLFILLSLAAYAKKRRLANREMLRRRRGSDFSVPSGSLRRTTPSG
jgi:hypothetical protein